MKRFVNVRLPLLIVFALIAGILLGYLFIRIKLSLFYIIALVPIIAIIFIFCVAFSRKRLLIFSFAATVFLISGTVASYVKINNYGEKELVNGDTYFITATVCEKGKYDGGEYVTVKNVKANGRKINGKIKAYLSDSHGDYCDVGYSVSFTAKITAYDTFPYGKLNYNAYSGVKYRCHVYGELTSSYRFSLFGAVNKAIRKTLYDNLGFETASISYAMLTGNTEGIEDGSFAAFRYGGVAHIFAVSGLHIGIIYGLLRFLCKKLRINKYLAFVICILPLFLYSGVCGFTSSSVRALIMCAVAAAAQIINAKYDALNSLALAATIILLINPLNLMNVGFQLSVCAVGGIVLLSKNIVRPFKKAPQKIKDAVGVSLSAQAGTLPVMLAKFGYLSGAGILLNILVVPVLSAIFAVIFLCTVLSVIFPFTAQYILPNAALPLEATVSFLTNAGFEKAIISGFGAGAFIPVYYFALFTLSDKFNLKLRYRLTAVICAVALLCTYVPLKTFMPFKDHKLIVSAYYGGGEVLIKSSEGNVLIITENVSLTNMNSFLNKYYSPELDAVIILGSESCVSVLGNADFNCDAYIFGEYINIQPFSGKTVNYEKSFSIGGIDFEFDNGYSLLAECGEKTFNVCYEYFEIDGVKVSFNERNFDNCVYDDGDYVFNLK